MSRVPRYRGVVVLLCVAIGALLAGCGSGGTNSDSSVPLSKTQYLKQGNKICKKGGEEKDQAVKKGLEEVPQKELTGTLSQKAMKKLVEGVLPYFQNIVTELAELQPPAKDKATVEKFIRKLEAVAVKTEANPLLIAESDPFNKAAEAARAYGLEDCVL